MSGDDRNEPRVRDLLKRAEEGAAEHDPNSVQSLMAWFEMPSFAEVPPGTGEPPPVDHAAEIWRKRDAAAAHANPKLLARLLRAETAPDAIHHPPVLPGRPWIAGERVLTFDEASLPEVPDLDNAREYEISPYLEDALKICTPQAFLRDLFRPETEFYIQMASPWDDGWSAPPPSGNPMDPIRETMRTDHRVRPALTPSPEVFAWARGQRKEAMGPPWADARREQFKQREEEMLGKPATAGSVAGKPEGAR